jgi:hypothetical protein
MVRPMSADDNPIEVRLRSEMMLRMAGNFARFGGWSLDVASGTLFWSDELCEILGYPAGKPPKLADAYALYPDVDRMEVTNAMDVCARVGTPFDQLHDMNKRVANGFESA